MKETRGTANSASSGTLQGWVRASCYPAYLKKCVKTCFFPAVGATWAPASQGSSLDATFYAREAGYLLLLQVTHILMFCSCLGVLCSGGTPNIFLVLFSEGFSDPRVYRYPMYLCSEAFFFAASKKCVQMLLLGTWHGASSRIYLCMCSYHI